MQRIGVVRNFTIGVNADGTPAAFFDVYYAEGQSVSVTLTHPAAIVRFLHNAGVLTAPAVNGTACIIDDSAHPPSFLRVANL